uniref:EGF-like domain-containing protein n=1 Tax=Caenorhabditis japonica TaxID=281687 RepID=A0A8R1HV76_CAEJA
MWRFLLLLTAVVAVGAQSAGPQPIGSDDVITSDRIFLKYPSSYANFTSDAWKLTENDHQLILAITFQASSIVGQIFSVRFIRPDGQLEALITAAISEGNLQIDLLNGRNAKILNKPLENVPINIHEHRLALGINTTSRSLWYKLGTAQDLNCEIAQPIDISNTTVVVTAGGGGQSMIGCVTLLAVSAGDTETSPSSMGTAIAFRDIDRCPDADECTTRDCNTGRCKLLEVPTCDCYGTEMTGPNCRRREFFILVFFLSTVQLRNNDENDETSAFLRYTPWQPDQQVSRIAMEFKFSDADAKEGILVYGETSEKQIFKVYVVGMKGKVMLDEENIMEFELRTDDSLFHNIIVRFSPGTFNLYVDEVVQRRHFNESLNFTTVQFGAPIPTDVSEVGVTACVKNIYVDHHDIIDLMMSNNDSRVLATKVRPCIDEDLSDISGIKLFSADPLVVLTSEPEIATAAEDDSASILAANLFPSPANKKKQHSMAPTSCEKPNAYKCQNGAGCKKDSDTEFTCFCRDGYIGKFCQFSK